jgi:hypothetical protein
MRPLLAACAGLLACLALSSSALAAGRTAAQTAPRPTGRTAAQLPPRPTAASSASPAGSFTHAANPEAPIPVPRSEIPPVGRRLSADQVLAIAARLPRMKQLQREHPGAYAGAYLKPGFHWQVSYFTRGGKKEIGQIIIDDLTGRVLEQWTGFQVAWTMARGYPGAFGRHVNSLYVWLPLCVLFLAPFLNYRKPLSLINLDLLVLLSFSVSLAFFNHGRIGLSVPLAYPPLLYLLARMLALMRRPGAGRAGPAPLRLLVPAPWLALAVVFLIGFRIALNVTDSNVVDVGYAGVIGAQRITEDGPLYGDYPADNEHGDTYGPVNYEAYVPFQQIFGGGGSWDDLPAAHGAAIFFDLLATALLFLLGRRMRGPTLGVALAYAWVAYPFTLFTLESNSNDTLVACLILAALLAATYRSSAATAARGAMAALAGLTKFAPLALAPLLATDALRQVGPRRRPLAYGLFIAGFVGAGALAFIPALDHNSLHTFYERTLAYQGDRNAPFSVWGLYSWKGVEQGVEIAAVAFAVILALVPRRMDMVGLSAACAAIMIAVQCGLEYWFYLYIPWFFPLALLALLGRFGEPVSRRPDSPSGPARSSLPEVVLSS